MEVLYFFDPIWNDNKMQSSKMQFGHKGLYEYRNLGQNIVLKVRHDSLAVTKKITSYIIESAYTVHHVDRNYCMYCDCTFFHR